MIKQEPEYLKLISGQAWLADPFPTFNVFRQRWPVARIDWPERGTGEWLITKYKDIRFVLSDQNFAINRSFANFGVDDLARSYDAEQEPLAGTVLTLDPPEHRLLRKPLTAFLAEQTMRLEPKLKTAIEAFLENFVDQQPFDLVADFAGPISASLIENLMDLPQESLAQLQRWSGIFVTRGFLFGPGFVSREVRSAVEGLKCFFIEAIARGKGLTSACKGPGSMIELTEQQVVNLSLLLVTAGMQTTKHAIVNAISVLIDHPEAWEELTRDHSIIESAIEECFRFEGPSQAVGRIARVDIELSNIMLKRGSFLRLVLASANRDDQVFVDPNAVNIRRQPNPHLAFGAGSHMCPGAYLARVATQLALQGLIRRFARLRRVSEGQERAFDNSLRGFERFYVVSD